MPFDRGPIGQLQVREYFNEVYGLRMTSRPDYSATWIRHSVQSQWDIAIVTFPEDASAIARRYILFKRHSDKLK